MVMRTGTARRKTRNKFSRPKAEHGKVPIRKFMQRFERGEKVILKADPFYQKGMYWRRFHGLIGTIGAKRGKSYEIMIKDGGKSKMVLVDPVHLKKV